MCLNEVYYLTLIAAEERLLVLIDPEFHAVFTRATAGQIAPRAKVELVALPADMQRTVDGVTDLARLDVDFFSQDARSFGPRAYDARAGQLHDPHDAGMP